MEEEDQLLEKAPLAAEEDSAPKEESSAMIIPNSKSEGIRDHYEFISDIGVGSFGTVQKVRNKLSNEELACKTIPKNGQMPIHIIQREVAALRAVQSHPHLIELKELFEDDMNVYILTELCTGGELYDRVATGKWAIKEKHVATLIGNILEAIAHCHEKGVVHRDLKASNFIFPNSKTDTDVRIIDFGLSNLASQPPVDCSQRSNQQHNNPTTETSDGNDELDLILKSQVGTPYYVAPEVLSGRDYNVKCDVWSVGVIAYLVLSRGRLPICGSDELETLELLKDPATQVSYPKRLWKKLSPDAQAFCQMMLERDPILRPSARSALKHKWLRKYRQRQRGGRTSLKFYVCLFVGSLATVSILVSLLSSKAIDMPEAKLEEMLQDRTVLVTGANSGLGLATVKSLARTGTAKKIILACRNTTRCQTARMDVEKDLPESSSTQVIAVSLDLANRTSIADGAVSIQEELGTSEDTTTTIGPLDILINNAGVAYAWSSKEFVDGIEMHMAINHLGHVLLTHYLWKNLLASPHGARIVHVSSLGALVSRHDTTDGWYNNNNNNDHDDENSAPPVKGKLHNTMDSMRYYFQSKRANLQQTWELHRRFNNNGITSVASHPGYTRSEILLKFQLPLCPKFAMRWLRQNEWGSMSTEDGAKTQLLAALSPEVPSGSYVVPKYWTFGRPILLKSLMTTSVSSHFYPFSESESSKLWNESLKALEISAFGE
ncbi:MAG: hypothetical protein SGBAC_003810 [Bacillariaceae sp.]